jgi:Ca2+-transporting ATPase
MLVATAGLKCQEDELSTQTLSRGLTAEEAARRLAEGSPNRVAEQRHVSIGSGITRQLRDPLILVLLGAAALTLATGDLTDAAVIGFVVVVNSAVGVAQELRADRAVAALSALTAPRARVRRDGREQEVAADDIVLGDILLVQEGDVVPADASLLEAHAFLVDEAALTGEAIPVGKAADGLEQSTISAGTVVVKGRAEAIVTATGVDSSLGRIAALLDVGIQTTPLQRRLAQLGRVLAVTAIALCALVMALGLLRGEPTERMVVTAISLAVAAVPESLPAVITLSLALGARAMARRHAIVRHLPAVETLGSVTVLATDKTGTLTSGRMRAETIYVRSGSHDVGGLTADGVEADIANLLMAVVLCNDASLAEEPSADRDGTGDPTEVALLLAGAKLQLGRAALDVAYPRVGELPFDSDRKRMTTIHRQGNGFLICMKGAPEVVCQPRRSEAGSAAFGAEIVARAATLAGAGYRVLAVATKHLDVLPGDLDYVERDLHLLGLVALADPPKEGAAAIVEACCRAGIVPILITGDHAATALTIARRVGIVDSHSDVTSVVTGQQLHDGSVDVTSARVFARIAPEQKLDIVEGWRQHAGIVAMVGDGVNDGPALRRADIGVAMGRRGTEVARQAADLVLADDNLGTVVSAVEEGRRIYSNVRRFLTFGLAGGVTEILVMLVGPFAGLTVPLSAAQILWINLLTHGLTGVALGAEPAAPESMTRAPRPPNESVLGDGLWRRVLRLAAVLTAVTLVMAMWAHSTGREWQSMIFVTMTTLQLGVALGLRARSGIRPNPFLPIAIIGSFALVVAGIYATLLRDLLQTSSLPLADLAVSAAVGVVGWLAVRADLWVFGKRSATQ